jgi:hypothetical protein
MSGEEVFMSQVVVEGSSDPFDDVVEEGDFTNEDIDTEIEASDSESSDDTSEEEPTEINEESSSSDEETGEPQETDGDGDTEDSTEEIKEPESEESELTLETLQEQLEKGDYKVNINDEEVSLQDLKNDYIGQKEIKRRFSEYDTKTKSHEQEVKEVNEYINTFAAKMKDGDSVGAMQYFAQFADIPPYMVKEQLIAALRPEIERRAQMSPVEIQNENLQAQNEYMQQKQESEQERRQTEQANMDLQNSINQLREAHNIDEAEWDDTFKHLDETLDADVEITAELVQDTILYSRRYEQAENILSEYDASQLGEAQEEWVESLVDVMVKHPDWSREDYKQVMDSALNTKTEAESKLAKKIEAKKPQKQTLTQKKPQMSQEEEELEDFFS